MTDPYKVLNVPRTADDEEIKKAYRALARKYHPDNYAGSDLADMAQEKMKEINEAYDTIRRERASSGTSFGASSGPSARNGSASSGAAGDVSMVRIRTLINSGRYGEAGVLLDSVDMASRGAEWNYLKGCILLQRGWYFDAQRYFEIACYMEPSNAEYQAALENIRGAAGQYGKTYRSAPGCSPCSLCAGLICADGICECCGGDLIRCC